MRLPTSARPLSGAFALGAALLAGCTDQTATPVSPEARPAVSAAPANDAEHAALDSVTHAVALALNDAGLRQRIKKDMQSSRFTIEHKLEFARYVRGESGGILLAKMAKASGRTHEQMMSLLGRVRPLEFYMPVDAHREGWTGTDDVVVASLLDDGEVPVAYTLAGKPLQVPLGGAPELPTLVITGSETDFTAPLDEKKVKNRNDRGGETIGTLDMVQPPCTSEGCPGSGPSAAVYPAGVYLHSASINDLGENDLRGDPEIEFFVIGPTYHDDSQGERISCSGQGASGAKYYDQQTNSWSAPIINVGGQILTKQEVSQYYSVYSAPYGLQIWEDDDTPCDIKNSGRSELKQLYDNLMSAQRATTILASILNPATSLETITLSGRPGYALRTAVLGAFQSDDDFVGNVVYTPGTESTGAMGDTYVTADLARPSGSSVVSNGTIRLRTVNQAH